MTKFCRPVLTTDLRTTFYRKIVRSIFNLCYKIWSNDGNLVNYSFALTNIQYYIKSITIVLGDHIGQKSPNLFIKVEIIYIILPENMATIFVTQFGNLFFSTNQRPLYILSIEVKNAPRARVFSTIFKCFIQFSLMIMKRKYTFFKSFIIKITITLFIEIETSE